MKKYQGAKSYFRGHPIVWRGNADDGMWLYLDTLELLPEWGGEARPCVQCGQKEWSGEGEVDECLGVLPGVDNACCGHGIRAEAYIRFLNGIVVKGFTVERPDNMDKKKTACKIVEDITNSIFGLEDVFDDPKCKIELLKAAKHLAEARALLPL